MADGVGNFIRRNTWDIDDISDPRSDFRTCEIPGNFNLYKTYHGVSGENFEIFFEIWIYFRKFFDKLSFYFLIKVNDIPKPPRGLNFL